MREISRAVEVMLMADTSKLATKVDIARYALYEILACIGLPSWEACCRLERVVHVVLALDRLWLHEMQRQFGDRLVSIEDRKWTERLLIKQIAAVMQLENELADCVCSQIVFGDFAQLGTGKTYAEIAIPEEQMNILLSRQAMALVGP